MEILGISIVLSILIVCATIILLRNMHLPIEDKSTEFDKELKKIEFIHKLELEKQHAQFNQEYAIKQEERKKAESEKTYELKVLELQLKQKQAEIQGENEQKKIVVDADVAKAESSRDVEIKRVELESQTFTRHRLPYSSKNYNSRW